jgi:hypothetical protein
MRQSRSQKMTADSVKMASEDEPPMDSSSEGSVFSPQGETEGSPNLTRTVRPPSSYKSCARALLFCQKNRQAHQVRRSGDASQTATSRRDDTDTYHRYVSAQVRKGRDLSEVHEEGRVKADEKRVKNRDYARNKLATGKARVAQLEGQVESLVRSNESLADEISQLEAEIAAKENVA